MVTYRIHFLKMLFILDYKYHVESSLNPKQCYFASLNSARDTYFFLTRRATRFAVYENKLQSTGTLVKQGVFALCEKRC